MQKNASLVWNTLTLSLYLLLGMLFLKGLTAVETPKLGCVRAWRWGRWSTGPCCFRSVCRDELVVGQRNPRADSGLKNQVLIASWVRPLRFYKWKTAENNAGCSLLVSGCPCLFPETGIWSAGQCSDLVLPSAAFGEKQIGILPTAVGIWIQSFQRIDSIHLLKLTFIFRKYFL